MLQQHAPQPLRVSPAPPDEAANARGSHDSQWQEIWLGLAPLFD